MEAMSRKPIAPPRKAPTASSFATGNVSPPLVERMIHVFVVRPGVAAESLRHGLWEDLSASELAATFTALGDGMFIAANCVRGDKAVVRDVLAHPDQYYVNVHTASFPGGAVSGTLA